MGNRPEGISALVRCRDEGDSVYLSLLSIKDTVDEIVFVDNASCDNSIEEAQRFQRDWFTGKSFVLASFDEDTSVGDNLALMNNYTLSKTTMSWIFKWDVDTVAHTDGPHSISRIRDVLHQEVADIFRFGYWNLWGDLHHYLARKGDEAEHGPTGCGLEVQGLEQRLFRFDETFHYSMTRYADHFWERPNFPSAFRQQHINIVPGVHLQTVKPSEIITRRYFLTRYGPGERARYARFGDFVDDEISRANFATRREFGQHLLVQKLNAQGARFSREHPALFVPLLESYPYRFIFEGDTCTGREEPERTYDYFGAP